MSYFHDSAEWKYLFKNAIDWDVLIPLYHKSFPTEDGIKDTDELLDFYQELLTQIGEWCKDSVAPRARRLDHEGAGTVENDIMTPGPALLEFYEEAKQLEVFGLSVDPKYGGMGLPVAISLLGVQQVAHACISSFTQAAFFTSIADMLERFCDKEDCDKFIPLIAKGEISGSMCLTEPGAGSDLGSLKTTATKNPDGTYSLNGSKIFITNGGGGLGLVLARVKDAPKGLKGISLFFVEEWLGEGENKKHNYRITKNEEKMGLHGSFTCEVVYENTQAKLVGKENEGLSMMFHLMNEARVAVGLQALGGMEACLDVINKYSCEREQFGRKLMDLPLYKKNIDEMKVECDAFRAFMVDTISHFDIYQKLHLKKTHDSLSKSEKALFRTAWKVVRRRTPLVKYYGAEKYTEMSVKTIQALGGYGFMQEYDAERIHRDSFAPLLYEGTSQIQALMALKDLMKYITKNPGAFFLSTIGNNPLLSFGNETDEFKRSFLTVQYQFKKNLIPLVVKCLKPNEFDEVFNVKSWQDEKGIEGLMTHAETITQALSYIETLRVLSQHASKDSSRIDLFNHYLKLIRPRMAAIYAEWKED